MSTVHAFSQTRSCCRCYFWVFCRKINISIYISWSHFLSQCSSICWINFKPPFLHDNQTNHKMVTRWNLQEKQVNEPWSSKSKRAYWRINQPWSHKSMHLQRLPEKDLFWELLAGSSENAFCLLCSRGSFLCEVSADPMWILQSETIKTNLAMRNVFESVCVCRIVAEFVSSWLIANIL